MLADIRRTGQLRRCHEQTAATWLAVKQRSQLRNVHLDHAEVTTGVHVTLNPPALPGNHLGCQVVNKASALLLSKLTVQLCRQNPEPLLFVTSQREPCPDEVVVLNCSYVVGVPRRILINGVHVEK